MLGVPRPTIPDICTPSWVEGQRRYLSPFSRAQSGEVPTAVRRRLRDKLMNLEHDPIESDRIML
jgi:hypothetical protein